MPWVLAFEMMVVEECFCVIEELINLSLLFGQTLHVHFALLIVLSDLKIQHVCSETDLTGAELVHGEVAVRQDANRGGHLRVQEQLPAGH